MMPVTAPVHSPIMSMHANEPLVSWIPQSHGITNTQSATTASTPIHNHFESLPGPAMVQPSMVTMLFVKESSMIHPDKLPPPRIPESNCVARAIYHLELFPCPAIVQVRASVICPADVSAMWMHLHISSVNRAPKPPCVMRSLDNLETLPSPTTWQSPMMPVTTPVHSPIMSMHANEPLVSWIPQS